MASLRVAFAVLVAFSVVALHARPAAAGVSNCATTCEDANYVNATLFADCKTNCETCATTPPPVSGCSIDFAPTEDGVGACTYYNCPRLPWWGGLLMGLCFVLPIVGVMVMCSIIDSRQS